MLTDPEEIRIISRARQKNVRNPSRSRKHFEHIFKDFLGSVDFAGSVFLDLGPGQYDFAELSRQRGAIVHGVDNDPAVVELGRYKSFPVRYDELKKFKASDYDVQFDGVFCKYSINAFWFCDSDQQHAEYIRGIVSLLKPDGWAWIGPWNGVPRKKNLSQLEIARVLAVQTEVFRESGFVGVNLSDRLSKYYGIHGATGNRALFFRNLPKPNRLSKCTIL